MSLVTARSSQGHSCEVKNANLKKKTHLQACAHIQVATLSQVLCKLECRIPSYSKNGYVGAKIKTWRVGGILFLPNHLMIIFLLFIYLFRRWHII